MKPKLYENIGGNKFKLLVEAINPDRTELVRAGIKKVFSTGDKEISYYRLENVGFGYIKDVSTAKKCAIQESIDLAPEFGYENDKDQQKFVKQGVAKENRFAPRDNPATRDRRGAWWQHDSENDIPGQWDNPIQAEELQKKLLNAIDAGNFDLARKYLKALEDIHN